jgi:hypothetical protein
MIKTLSKTSYFFKRVEFQDTSLKTPYYLYKGYYTKSEEKYPVILHFGRDEIVISCMNEQGIIAKVFSFFVAEGGHNQIELTEKIENYWDMPLWPLTTDNKKINITKDLDSISYFRFFKQKNYNGDNKIDFRRILLDFLFELEYTNTFEDKNFFTLRPTLKNNKLLDAISRKCNYLYELYHVREFEKSKPDQMLPARFINAEKAWLNVCFNEDYSEVFNSKKSVFKPVEEEVELVIFKSVIGKIAKNRTECFTINDSNIRNQSATFFLRQYSLFNAFKTIKLQILIIFSLLFLFSILSPILNPIVNHCNEASLKLPEQSLAKFIGFSDIFLPVIFIIIVGIYYRYTGINIFKLILPRLFLGILLGWSIFWSTSDLWKSALITNVGKVIILDLVLIVIIFLIIYTRIQNRLIRAKGSNFVKALHLLLFAMFISFIQGFYVLQFMAEPMLENSDFLKKDNARLFPQKTEDVNQDKKEIKEINVSKLAIEPMQKNESSAVPHTYPVSKLQEQLMVKATLKDVTLKVEKSIDDSDNNMEILTKQDRKLYGINNYTSLPVWNNKEFKIYHIWSIHLSQFVMSILNGIIWLLIWEDRPITEPL